MKVLDKSTLLGTGTKRSAYIDPENEDRCIKILDSKDNQRNIRRELVCYRILKKQNISWDMMIQYYGTVETDQGIGHVFDLVRDFDGKVSETLRSYFTDEKKFKTIPNLLEKIETFKKYLIDNKIILADPGLANILYKKSSENDGTFVIVDGVENTDFIPIASYINYFKRKKIMRCIKKFDTKLMAHETYKNFIDKNNNKSL